MFCLIVCFLLCVSFQAAAHGHEYILYIDSYHQGYPWSDGIAEGISSYLTEHGQMEVAIEHLDAKRFPEEDLHKQFVRLLEMKYSDDLPSAVIVSDDPAFNLLSSYRQSLFADIPLIFLGINRFSSEKIAGQQLTFGIADSPDLKKTLDAALQLHPDAGHVVIVHDRTVTGMADRARAIEFLEDHPDVSSYTFRFLTDLTLDEIPAAVSQLPGNSVILALHFIVDAEGRYIDPDAYITALASSGHPVYIVNDLGLGTSPAVGGYIRSSRTEGRLAAGLALDAIESPMNEPLRQSAKEYIFNYDALLEHGIELSALPEGARVINSPPPLDEQVRNALIVLAFSLAAALIMLVLLLHSRRQLRRQADLLKNAFNQFPQPVCASYYHSRQPIFINDAMISILMLSQNEDILLKDKLYLHERLQQVLNLKVPDDAEMQAVGQQEILTFELNSRAAEKPMHVVMQKIPFIWQGRQAIMTSLMDVTEQRIAEQKLRQSEKLQAVGQLTGGIAHDFNNQIMAIMGYAQLLELKVEDPSLQEYVKYIIMAAESSRALTGKLLAYSRNRPAEISPVPLNTCVTNTVELIRHAVDKRIEVISEIPDDPVKVQGDKAMIENALLNLCLNAADAIPGNGMIKLKLSLIEDPGRLNLVDSYLETPGPYACITVTDTGSGISEQLRTKIFDPFFTTKLEGHGTGMGLPSVLRTVKNLRGAMALESIDGKGTSFMLIFEALEDTKWDTPEKVESGISEAEPSGSAAGRSAYKVLIVDDEHLVRHIISRMLEQQGYQVTTAHDGYSALEAFSASEADFDLVILDMIMPRLNGLQTFRVLRGVRPDMKIILISGYSDLEQVEKMREEGLSAFLEKPISRQVLLDTVAEVLSAPEGQLS
jgi:signal transduction histidine kinase/ActR/RegA family two-component response regulator